MRSRQVSVFQKPSVAIPFVVLGWAIGFGLYKWATSRSADNGQPRTRANPRGTYG